jgi:very-short-patch-repair endonuclease
MSSSAWALARRQHRVLARTQLLELGFNAEAIKHRVSSGRLHPVRRGVYAVGAPDLTQHGHFMAAVLSCGEGATLSHQSAAALWGIRPTGLGQIHVSVPTGTRRRCPGVVVHPRQLAAGEVTKRHGIPVTTPVCTLIDLTSRVRRAEVERAINKADDLGLADPETLRAALDHVSRRPGAKPLRTLLDRPTFRMTRSELERRFLPIVRRAGLPTPLTKQQVNGFEVDFYWPDLDLVVETDGLRYHRTPQQQAKDSIRDQVHAAAGVERLRFTHDQIAHDPGHVERTLAAVADRISRTRINSVALP